MRQALVLAALVAFPLAAKIPLADVPLAWRATRSAAQVGMPAVDLLPFQGRSLTLVPFTDGREQPALIGENREKRSNLLPVTTREDVPAWVTARTREFLASLGLPLRAPEAEASGLVIRGEVVSFFVAEGDEYLGDVRLRIQVLKDGETVWSGQAMGAADHSGRSYKLENYQETLSDSLLQAWVSLFRSQTFLKALSR